MIRPFFLGIVTMLSMVSVAVGEKKAPTPSGKSNSLELSKLQNSDVAISVGGKIVTVGEILKVMLETFGERILQLREGNPELFLFFYLTIRDSLAMQKLFEAEARKQKKDKKLFTTPLMRAEFLKRYLLLLVDTLLKKLYEVETTEELLKQEYEKRNLENVVRHDAFFSDYGKARRFISAVSKSGQNFNELASKHADNSRGPVKVLESALDPMLKQHISSIKEGGVSPEPLSIGGNRYVVIKLVKRSPATFEESKSVLEQLVRPQIRNRAASNLSKDYGLKVFSVDGKADNLDMERKPPASVLAALQQARAARAG
jgi:hypothetical protein